MKLIAQVKLDSTPEQTDALKRTLETANAAANYASDYAWANKVFRQFDLHRALYYDLRERFALSAQVTVRVLGKVADAYKLDHKTKRTFKPLGSIAYDERILAWRLADSTVSLWTVAGRLRLPFLTGERQLALLRSLQGEADLLYRDGACYLYQTCDVEGPPPEEPLDYLGIDLGIVSLAVDSDGEVHSGAGVERGRRIYAHRRRNLQRKGTKAARRKLKRLAGKQARYQTDTNHVISKCVVRKAQDSGRAIILENLKGIRGRVTVRRRQRARHANWSFSQLRDFIVYKAALAGVLVLFVDPRNTSRTCPLCDCIDKANRPNQASFSCTSCGYAAPADVVAAGVIRARAVVNRPMVSTTTEVVASGTSRFL